MNGFIRGDMGDEFIRSSQLRRKCIITNKFVTTWALSISNPQFLQNQLVTSVPTINELLSDE
jgi:hypothetical protein